MKVKLVVFWISFRPLYLFEDNAALLRPISLEEVKEAVFLLDGDSAPGPDGFSGRFFQACWEVLSADFFLRRKNFLLESRSHVVLRALL